METVVNQEVEHKEAVELTGAWLHEQIVQSGIPFSVLSRAVKFRPSMIKAHAVNPGPLTAVQAMRYKDALERFNRGELTEAEKSLPRRAGRPRGSKSKVGRSRGSKSVDAPAVVEKPILEVSCAGASDVVSLLSLVLPKLAKRYVVKSSSKSVLVSWS